MESYELRNPFRPMVQDAVSDMRIAGWASMTRHRVYGNALQASPSSVDVICWSNGTSHCLPGMLAHVEPCRAGPG